MSRKVAIVTGGAQRVGRCIATYLHEQGYDLFVHYRHSAHAALSLQNELNAKRADSVAICAQDLNALASVTSIIDRALQRFGRIDALVNNASSFYPTTMGEITLEQINDLFASNAIAPLLLAQAAAPSLKQSKGAIVNIVDIYAERPLPRYTPYCMAKAALVNATYALARELAPEVRVNGIAPGNILWSTNMEKAETPAIVVERAALQRQGEPHDIARTVHFLLSDAPYVTGQILRVDGGRWLFI
jgi:pteridine reductase